MTEPVVLLPVRIETRSGDQGATLRVRIYPDDIHVDSLERGVSDDERTAGQAYWRAVWQVPGAAGAWADLVRRVGTARAAWVSQALTPTNLDRRPTDPPAFPDPGPQGDGAAVVRVLPRQFLVTVVQGTATNSTLTQPIPDALTVGPPRTWTRPAPFPDGIPSVPDAMRWLFDFDAAVAVGMAVTIRLPRPGAPVDRLTVVGWRDDIDPQVGSAQLAALLEAHLYTDGTAFVPQGSPTNNTDTDRSEWSRRLTPPGADPAPAAPAPGSNADVLARTLDIPAATLAALDHAADQEQPRAEAMATALWEVTWGTLLEKLTGPATPGRSLAPGALDELQAHASAYVRGRGPLPALRVGKQPYGVLPATDLTAIHPVEGGTIDAGLMGFLARWRTLWSAGVANVPTVMSGDVDQQLPEILGTSGAAQSLRVRSLTEVTKCYEPMPFMTGTDGDCRAQAGIDEIAREFLGVDATQTNDNGLIGKASADVTLPLADPTDPAYIDRLLAYLEAPDPASPPEPPASVLQALLALAAIAERTEWQAVAGRAGREKVQVALRGLRETPVDLALVSRALAATDTPSAGARHQGLLVEAVSMLDSRVGRLDRGAVQGAYPVPGVTIGSVVGAATRENSALLTEPTLVLQLAGEMLRPAMRHGAFTTALSTIKTGTTTEERALLLAETLDTASHRFDAWATSIAARRLSSQRAAGVRGARVGAFGWVENIELVTPAVTEVRDGPAGTLLVSPHDGGYIHAPSLDHAATAGVLRSARLTHDPADSGSDQLSIDLSSTRVREAVHVIEGIQQGQPLGALLGYRLERWLHDRNLDRFIWVLRGLAPLTAGKLGDAPTGSLESVAAANVLDGVALLDLYGTTEGKSKIQAALASGPADAGKYNVAWPSTPDGGAVMTAIGELEGIHDAVADVLLAESVHQVVLGNTARATSALNAAGGGDGLPANPDVIRTPTSGTAFTHRLAVLAPEPVADGNSGWSETAPLARAEPRLEAWARAQLGPSTGIVLTLSAAGQAQLTLANLGICALDLVTSADSAQATSATLVARLQQVAADPGLQPASVRPAAWGSRADLLLFAEAWELARRLRSVLAGARALTPAGFTLPHDAPTPPRQVDLTELSARVKTAGGGLGTARDALVTAISAGTAAPIAERIGDLIAYGIRPPVAASALAGDALDALAQAILAESDRRLAAAQAALTLADAAAQAALAAVDIAAVAAADGARLSHLQDAFSAVFDPPFPALPVVLAPATADVLIDALAAASPADGAVVRPWLSRWASVRPSLARYTELLTVRSALTRVQQLRVAQLPSGAFPSWIGEPFPATEVPSGPITSIVFDLPSGAALTGHENLAGFVADEWVEVVPRRTAITDPAAPDAAPVVQASKTTGVAVNAQAPHARAPQAVLIAVTPDDRPWTAEKLLGVVEDTLRLAKERAVTLERLPLAPRILPALYVRDWSYADDPVLDVVALIRERASADAAMRRFVKG